MKTIIPPNTTSRNTHDLFRGSIQVAPCLRRHDRPCTNKDLPQLCSLLDVPSSNGRHHTTDYFITLGFSLELLAMNGEADPPSSSARVGLAMEAAETSRRESS